MMKSTQQLAPKSSIFDEFQRYHIPNIYVPWDQLEPTLGVYPPKQGQISTGKWVAGAQMAQEAQKKKKIKSNSAYSLFFHEQQAIVKKYKPSVLFGEISQYVAQRWDSLSDAEKKEYKSRCEKNRKLNIDNAAAEKVRQLMMTASS